MNHRIFTLRGRPGTIYDRATCEIDANALGIANPEKLTIDDEKAITRWAHQTRKECPFLTSFDSWENTNRGIYHGDSSFSDVVSLHGFLFFNYSFEPYSGELSDLVTTQEVVQLVKKDLAQKYSAPPKKISEEDYWEALECLPPCRFDGSAFYISEAMEGSYHSMYASLGNEVFMTAIRDINEVSNNDFIKECRKIDSEKTSGPSAA